MKPRWLSRVISTSLSGESPTELRLTWHTNQQATTELEDELFGKRILFTDRDEWTIAAVFGGYRSQSEVEADFRQMKDPDIVSFSPMFHWTDQKMRVHSFYCVIALTIARLMRREAQRAGISISVTELLNTLGGIEETVLLYQAQRGDPAPDGCSPRSTPPNRASTTSSTSTPTPPNADLGTTPQQTKHPN